jgi:hypothetical protein
LLQPVEHIPSCSKGLIYVPVYLLAKQSDLALFTPDVHADVDVHEDVHIRDHVTLGVHALARVPAHVHVDVPVHIPFV